MSVSRFCSLCELTIRDGDLAVFVAEVKLEGGEIKYENVNLFHQKCWDNRHPEPAMQGVSDANETPQPPHDTPPVS